MICKHCKEKNIYKAQFCSKCGHPFSEKDREEAYSKTIFGMINKLEELYSWMSLDKITGSTLFKVASIAVVLGLGIVSVYKNGTEFRILDHDSYDVQYNTLTDEYYLLSNSDIIKVSLYLPGQSEEIKIVQMDEKGNILDSEVVSLTEEIQLVNDTKYIYRLEADSGDGNVHSLTLRVFEQD